jgi:hypothetical protein
VSVCGCSLQAAALLAAEPEALGTASGWAWDDPAPVEGAELGMLNGGHSDSAAAKNQSAAEAQHTGPGSIGALQKPQGKKAKKVKKGMS